MTSIIDVLVPVTIYSMAWLAISLGFTFIIAAAFFGPKEISKEEYDELFERRRD